MEQDCVLFQKNIFQVTYLLLSVLTKTRGRETKRNRSLPSGGAQSSWGHRGDGDRSRWGRTLMRLAKSPVGI